MSNSRFVNNNDSKICFLKNKIYEMESLLYEIPPNYKESRIIIKNDILTIVNKLKNIGYDYYS